MCRCLKIKPDCYSHPRNQTYRLTFITCFPYEVTVYTRFVESHLRTFRQLFTVLLFYSSFYGRLHSHSFEYHVAELVVVDHAVVVEVCVGQHLLDLLVGQLFVGEVHHALLELGLADEAVTVGVKHAKRVLDLGPNSIEKI